MSKAGRINGVSGMAIDWKRWIPFSGGVPFDFKRWFFFSLGVGLFLLVYYSPPWPDAIDPAGKSFVLNQQAKGALALFYWPAPSGSSKCCPSASPVC
jgi:hypothetical protein